MERHLQVNRRMHLLTDQMPIVSLEADAAGDLQDPIPAVVVAAVMEAAQKHHVVEVGRSAERPVLQVMRVGLLGRYAAAGEAAEPVADFERAAQPLRRAAVLAADIDRQAVPLDHGDDLRVATDPARCGCRQWSSICELAQTIWRLTGEDADVDVNDNLSRLTGNDEAAGNAREHMLGNGNQCIGSARRPSILSRIRYLITG